MTSAASASAAMTFIIHYRGHFGSACIDTQQAASMFEAVCQHRRNFGGRIISIRSL